jgi:hypothetical protein
VESDLVQVYFRKVRVVFSMVWFREITLGLELDFGIR